MQIIKKESPKRLKYDMFKRLNTGGLLLSAQEIRNSTIRLLDETFIDFIQEIKSYPSFRNTLKYVMEEQINEQFDDELVLRFFTLKNGNLKSYHGTLADYLTSYAENVADEKVSFDFYQEKQVFNKTFDLLDKILPNGNIFVSLNGKIFQKQFLAFHFEAFTISMAKFQDKIDISDNVLVEKLSEAFKSLKNSESFKIITKNEKEKRTSGSKYLKYFKERVDAVSNEIKIQLK